MAVDVVRLFDDADDALVAAVGGAVVAGIRLGDVAAHRAVRDAFLDFTDRVAESIDLFAGSFQEVKRKPFRALRTDAG